MHPPASDEELGIRQQLLQNEAKRLLAELEACGLFADVGAPLTAGSYVSGLMCWRDLDIGVLGGPEFGPHDVLRLLHRAVDIDGVVGFTYRDERGPRSPSGDRRDERYHVPIAVERDTGVWRIDLTIWLHDIHANVTAWHEMLRDTITEEQRRAVLRIKDVWHKLPSYPDQISGLDVYTAVLDHGVREPDQFAAWLAHRGGTPAS